MNERPHESGAAQSGRFIVISGCSGGGKSTLIDALARRGHRTVEEPARRLLQADPGANLRDPAAFTEVLVQAYVDDLEAVNHERGLVFFDRSLLDVVSWYHRAGASAPPHLADAIANAPYDRVVFLVPPWPEIFETDAERTHTFESAVAEYESLVTTYPRYGHEVMEVPRASVHERVAFVLESVERH